MIIVAIIVFVILFYLFAVGLSSEIIDVRCPRCHRLMEEYNSQGWLKCKHCEQYSTPVKPRKKQNENKTNNK